MTMSLLDRVPGDLNIYIGGYVGSDYAYQFDHLLIAALTYRYAC